MELVGVDEVRGRTDGAIGEISYAGVGPWDWVIHGAVWEVC